MRKIVMGLAAAGLLLTAAPAFAQIGVEVGPGGVGVGIGRDRGYSHDRVYEERRVYRDGDRYDGRRYRTYGQMDIQMMQEAAPVAPVLNSTNRILVSSRVSNYTYNDANTYTAWNALVIK